MFPFDLLIENLVQITSCCQHIISQIFSMWSSPKLFTSPSTVLSSPTEKSQGVKSGKHAGQVIGQLWLIQLIGNAL